MNLKYQRPKRVKTEELSETYGKFIAEPFERGYGTTLGIALRRVLHSLIEGSAVSAVRFDGVLHEFSTIPGVFEDVLNIILNIKNIPFLLLSDEPKILRIEKSGPGDITSGDITGDGDAQVLDGSIHIASLEEGASLKGEIVIKKGTGYKLAEYNFDEELPVDFIPIDSNFNPIERVKYEITPARVGKRTDYEKLTLEIWTNGSISPKDALASAGKILRDHLSIFLGSKEKDILSIDDDEEGVSDLEKNHEFLGKNVESIGLSVRALKCLKRLGVDYIFELIEKTEHELMNSKNFGKKSLEEIITKLEEFNLTLGQKLPEQMKQEFFEKAAKLSSTESTESETEKE